MLLYLLEHHFRIHLCVGYYSELLVKCYIGKTFVDRNMFLKYHLFFKNLTKDVSRIATIITKIKIIY